MKLIQMTEQESLLEQALGMKTTYTEHFFDNRTYPASWKRTDNAVNALLKKIKEQIARQWVEGYLKPELEHFGREVTLETVKENLHLKGKRDALLYDEKEQVSQYLTQKMTALGISPDFRYIEPEHFAVILKAYYEFLKECEGLNQAHVAALFGIKGDQSTFSKYLKLNNMKKVSIQAENNILRSLLRYFMHTGDMSLHARLEVGQIYVPCFRNGFHAELFQNNRFFAGYYLVNLLKIRQITFSNGHEPFTIPEVNGILCDRQLLTVGEHVWLENCAAPGDALQSFLRKQDPGYVRSTGNSFLNSLLTPDEKMPSGMVKKLQNVRQQFREYAIQIFAPAEIQFILKMKHAFFYKPHEFFRESALISDISSFRSLTPEQQEHFIASLSSLPNFVPVFHNCMRKQQQNILLRLTADCCQILLCLSPDHFRRYSAFYPRDTVITCREYIRMEQKLGLFKKPQKERLEQDRRELEQLVRDTGISSQNIAFKLEMNAPEWYVYMKAAEQSLLGKNHLNDLMKSVQKEVGNPETISPENGNAAVQEIRMRRIRTEQEQDEYAKE